eukprot:scaffold1411_cov396-Prasinococcus_capsulatus_cf.AAC.30
MQPHCRADSNVLVHDTSPFAYTLAVVTPNEPNAARAEGLSDLPRFGVMRQALHEFWVSLHGSQHGPQFTSATIRSGKRRPR